MWILWLVITGVIILLIVGLSINTRAKQPSALDILDRRFASGEITEQEYNEKKALLQQQNNRGEIK